GSRRAHGPGAGIFTAGRAALGVALGADIDDVGEVAAVAIVDLHIRADIDLAGDIAAPRPGARRADAAELQGEILGARGFRLGAVVHDAERCRIDERRDV